MALTKCMSRYRASAPITLSELKEYFHYDPKTGEMTRLKARANCGKVGEVVGTPNCHGHLIVRFRYRIYYVHRLIWLYMTGEWPKEVIDHINGVTADNRWVNLREATYKQNCWNRGVSRRNKSGVRGVDWFKQYGCWRAIIKADGKDHFLGYFKSKKEAAEVRRRAELELFGEFARAA